MSYEPRADRGYPHNRGPDFDFGRLDLEAAMTPTPEILHCSRLLGSCQACVPTDWSDERVVAFVDAQLPVGGLGWTIRRQGDPRLSGDPERVVCGDGKPHVHVMLDAQPDLDSAIIPEFETHFELLAAFGGIARNSAGEWHLTETGRGYLADVNASVDEYVRTGVVPWEQER